jgi:hypothetical protein
MHNEADIAGETTVEGGQMLSFRDGIYRLRLRLSALDAPHEITLHGVSRRADALSIVRFFENNLLKNCRQEPDGLEGETGDLCQLSVILPPGEFGATL